MIRVAIIGAGIGAEHLAGYRALDRYEVAALCDLDLDRAQTACGGTVFCTDDMAPLLADPSIDMIDICLPPHLHFDTAVAALEAGKHVVCEKPLVRSLAEADRLIAVASQSGRKIFPVFQYRYGPAFQQLRALIDAGLAGKPYVASIETHWNRGADYYAVPWRGTWAGESGGAVLGHAIHAHDLLSHILGPVAEVTALTATRVNDIETEDCAALALRMENGALATSSVTLGAASDTSRLRFCFEGFTAESGSVPYAPGTGAWTFCARAPLTQARIDAVLAKVVPRHSGFAGFLEAIADALDGTEGDEVTLADGRRSVEFVTAVYASVRSGAPVALPLADDTVLYHGWLPEQVA